MCLGFSLLGVVELVYFATVKLYYNRSHAVDDSEKSPPKKEGQKSVAVSSVQLPESKFYLNDFAHHEYVLHRRKYSEFGKL